MKPKRIILKLINVLFTVNIIAQAPYSFKYQALLRDASGNAKFNTNANVRIDLLQGTITGTNVFAETFAAQTNAYGLINLEIGKGTLVFGNINNIDWSAGPYFIKISIDGIEFGTSQLMSVPYALYANKAGNGFSGNYNDLINKPNFAKWDKDSTDNVTIAGAQTISGSKTFSNQIIASHGLNASGYAVTNVLSPVNSSDAATKAYVDALLAKVNELNILNEKLRDYDGNLYPVVKIGKQIWMAENLRVTHYNNGDAIATTTPPTKDISGETSPKYQWNCNNDPLTIFPYGKLYTWFVITDSRKVCPTGWHVPTNPEFQTLIDTIGGISVAGAKMKEIGAIHWDSDNTKANNSTGFTALGGGFREGTSFFDFSTRAYFWTSTEGVSPANGYFRFIYSMYDEINSMASDKKDGYNVRCLKD